MPRMRLAEHEVLGGSLLRRGGYLAVLLFLVALAGCGGEESALTSDLAGPGDLRAGAEMEGPHAPPWLEGGDPVSHMTKALDAAGIAGADRAKVDALVTDFRKDNAGAIAKLARAAAKAKAEAEQGNPPDRARWQALIAAEGLEPGALRDEMRALRRSINEVLTAEQRQQLRSAWHGDRRGGYGRFARWGERVIADLNLTPDQEREIQRLLTDFGAKHQGEIKALQGVIKDGDLQPGRGARRGRGPGSESCPEPGAGPGPQAGPGPNAGEGQGPRHGRGMGPGAGLGLGPQLQGELTDALTAAGYDPEAFKKNLGALHDQAVALLTAEQKEKLRGHGLHLIRRLLVPATAETPATPAKP